MAQWADHLIWYKDGRFAKHSYFKFIVHNIIIRKRTLEQSTYIVKQQLGDEHMTISELKEQLQNGNNSIPEKILYFGANLRGTSQYWAQRAKELRALIQYQINEGKGLPSFFTTGSCAEYHFKPLHRLLEIYTLETTGEKLIFQIVVFYFQLFKQIRMLLLTILSKELRITSKKLWPLFSMLILTGIGRNLLSHVE